MAGHYFRHRPRVKDIILFIEHITIFETIIGSVAYRGRGEEGVIFE